MIAAKWGSVKRKVGLGEQRISNSLAYLVFFCYSAARRGGCFLLLARVDLINNDSGRCEASSLIPSGMFNCSAISSSLLL